MGCTIASVVEDDLDVDPFAELAELAELMATNGENHGYRRSAGKWVDLSTGDYARSALENEPRVHGTRYTYQEVGCRCSVCRGWNAARSRARRSGL